MYHQFQTCPTMLESCATDTRLIGRKSTPCAMSDHQIGKYSRSLRASGNPEALETGKVLLNAGENCVQGNLAMVIKWSRL